MASCIEWCDSSKHACDYTVIKTGTIKEAAFEIACHFEKNSQWIIIVFIIIKIYIAITMKFIAILLAAIFMAVCISANKDQFYGQSTGSGSGNTIGSHNAQSG